MLLWWQMRSKGCPRDCCGPVVFGGHEGWRHPGIPLGLRYGQQGRSFKNMDDAEGSVWATPAGELRLKGGASQMGLQERKTFPRAAALSPLNTATL